MEKKKGNIFSLETKIELIGIRGDEVFKKEMTYGEALQITKKKGWVYRYYEIGFSQYEIKNKLK